MALDPSSLDISYGADGLPLNSFRNLGVSDAPDSFRGSGSAEPSVAGLRDRLLREARQERIRCLQVARASERWSADDVGGARSVSTAESATQTDPIAGTCTGATLNIVDLMASDTWNQSDEEAQMQAMKTIQLLSQKRSSTIENERRIAELEEMIRIERAKMKDLEASVARERDARESIQQQVLCLEAEMDVKESALQASQTALERREQSPLPHSRGALDHSFRQGYGRSVSPMSRGNVVLDSSISLTARRPLDDRDRKLEVKDQQISQLLRELRQSPSPSPATTFDQTAVWRSSSPSRNSLGFRR